MGVDSPDDPLASDLYLVPGDAPGFEVSGAFDGLGLRGNASAPMTLRGAELHQDQRLGEAGSGFGLMLSAPTTDLLYEFIGKAVTGQEVFARPPIG